MKRAKKEKNKKKAKDPVTTSAIFQLAHFYFEARKYEEAFRYYDEIKDDDDQALFQIAVMTYDGESVCGGVCVCVCVIVWGY